MNLSKSLSRWRSLLDMTPADIILLVIIALAVGGAIYYVYREKKAGKYFLLLKLQK